MEREAEWRIRPQADIAMIEPNSNLRHVLDPVANELDSEVYYVLLGAQKGRSVTFHLMGGSSIFEERSNVHRTTESHTLTTLDAVLKGWESIDLLKIDAQGYELEILKGAHRLLSRTISVLLEVSFIQVNDGAPLIDEVVRYMKDAGFVAREILEIHWRPLDRAMNQTDILFLRESSELLMDERH